MYKYSFNIAQEQTDDIYYSHQEWFETEAEYRVLSVQKLAEIQTAHPDIVMKISGSRLKLGPIGRPR